MKVISLRSGWMISRVDRSVDNNLINDKIMIYNGIQWNEYLLYCK